MRAWRMALAVVALASAPAGATVPNLAIDLSQHMVSIAADFAGTRLLLFGAAEAKSDVVVVVRGPSVPKVVRRKERISGIWMNRQSVQFDYVPSFYAVAASRPLAEIAGEKTLREHAIGVRMLGIRGPNGMREPNVIMYREALIRNMETQGLFSDQVDPVHLIGGGPLFRTDIRFPGNAPVGPYQVHVFLFKDGKVANHSKTPLVVSRVGFAAGVFDLAYRFPFAYGVLAIMIAAMAGWLANFIFRRGS